MRMERKFLITVAGVGKRYQKGAEIVYSRRVSVRHLKSTLKRAESLGKRYLMVAMSARSLQVRVRLDGRLYNEYSALVDENGIVVGVRDFYVDGYAHKDELIKKIQGGKS